MPEQAGGRLGGGRLWGEAARPPGRQPKSSVHSQAERFLEGGLLLERFAFRVASATFGWSRRDWKVAGRRTGVRMRASGGRF